VPWECAPHTKAKHDIYRRYLERWYPILMNGPKAYASVTYAEGFAGPGIYSGGEPGSPVIAMKALVDKVPPDRGVARFLFIDDDQRCVDMLGEQLRAAFPQRPRPNHTMPAVRITKGTCVERLEAELTDMQAWGQPIFANLDSWGNAPVPYRLLKRLASNVSSEVIVTLLPQHFVRFVSKMGEAGDEVFGGDPTWRDVAGMAPQAKSRHILTSYRQALKAAGFRYLLDFELIPPNGQPLYLVFGTSHPRGLGKMKDSLWEVDRTEGVGFRDPRDEQAETLFDLDEPLLGPLTRALEHKLRQSGPTRVEDLRDFALYETVYRPEHVIRSLKPLLDRGLLATNGPLRRSTIVELAPAQKP
jgi:three-Cys-motif partner protein